MQQHERKARELSLGRDVVPISPAPSVSLASSSVRVRIISRGQQNAALAFPSATPAPFAHARREPV